MGEQINPIEILEKSGVDKYHIITFFGQSVPYK